MDKISVTTLNITNRFKNVLIKNGINTIADLSKLSIDELVNIKGLELLSLKDIASEMYKNGYKFEGYVDLKSFEDDIVNKHREKTSDNLKRMILNATPMPVYNEEEFQILMEELYDKNNKIVRPLSERDTYYFREYLGINQLIYDEGEIVKLDPVYRVNKITVRNMSMIRIIYSRFDNKELEMNEEMQGKTLTGSINVNGKTISSYEDFSKITSIEFYDEFFEMTSRYKFYLTYKDLHDRGIYFKDEIEKTKQVEESNIDKEIEIERNKIAELQNKLKQSNTLRRLLVELLEQTDEKINEIINEIAIEQAKKGIK